MYAQTRSPSAGSGLYDHVVSNSREPALHSVTVSPSSGYVTLRIFMLFTGSLEQRWGNACASTTSTMASSRSASCAERYTAFQCLMMYGLTLCLRAICSISYNDRTPSTGCVSKDRNTRSLALYTSDSLHMARLNSSELRSKYLASSSRAESSASSPMSMCKSHPFFT